MRAENPAIYKGETHNLPSDQDHSLMAFFRRSGNHIVLVLLNVSKQNRLPIHIHHDWLKGNFRNVFSELSFQFSHSEKFELQAGEYLVYEKITD